MLPNLKRLIKTYWESSKFEELDLLKKINPLSDQELQLIEEIIQSEKTLSAPEIFGNGADKRWFGIQKNNPSTFSKLLAQRGIINIINRFFHTPSFLVMYNEIEAKENNLGSGGGWHFDSLSPQLKVIFYLTDVSQKNGPFQIVERSENKRFRQNYIIKNLKRKDILRVRDTIKEESVKTLTGKKGDGFLINTSSIHRGKPLQEGERRAITYYVFSSDQSNEKFDPLKSNFES